MFIEITRPTLLSGQPAAVGEVYEVDDNTARMAVVAHKAKLVDAPKGTIAEPPKPKIKKVSTKDE